MLNFHSRGWNLQSYCVLREKGAAFGIFKNIFVTVFWGAVVTPCVATRTWLIFSNLTLAVVLAALWKLIQNTTQSTGFWKTPVHNRSVFAAQLQWGHWDTQFESRDRCPFQWLELEHFQQVLTHLLGTTPISQMSWLIIQTLKPCFSENSGKQCHSLTVPP